MSSLVDTLEHAGLMLTGAVLCYLFVQWRNRDSRRAQAAQAQGLLDQSRREAAIILRDARLTASEEALKQHELADQAVASRRAERLELEKRLAEREQLINSQLQRMVESEKSLSEEKDSLAKRCEAIKSREDELSKLELQWAEQLQKAAGLSPTEAREALLKRVEQEALRHANALTRHILDEARSKAEEKARRILTVAIQRYAGEHTFESTTASIALPAGDDIKGRIIGREGRNIRAFEAATGVTVLIDDTPGAVLLSGFDPVRREIAREAMMRLLSDGRIHPTRIEEVVAAVNQEMNETILRLGEEAVAKAALPPMHPEVVKLLGRLHFRHSFSQNILDHSVEVAHLMALMAAEMGLDVTAAKRAGLLHDIGKAVNHEAEGPHAVVGAELIKRYGESDVVVNGVASHHNDVAPIGPLGILVSAADAISASRPGARSENLTTYLKRVEDLEKIANSIDGVEKSFAVQAGRELRVFVHPDQVDDEQAFGLARTLASRIENELQYPGQIRITVIRETRCVEVAK
ncbi:MAG TPA: ribonuclease Y [Candidatus Limnocylindrales bacterium]|jgi:ribonuclease Y|nr:ribonuclease Y [Candidatus Limnocylindrales bacterium]